MISPKSPSMKKGFLVSKIIKKGVTKYRNPFVWCGGLESNQHSLAATSPSSWRVYQFRHHRKLVNKRIFRNQYLHYFMYSICQPDEVSSDFKRFVCERHFLPIYTCNVNSKVMSPLFFRGLLRGRWRSDRLYRDRPCLFRSCFCRRLAGGHD